MGLGGGGVDLGVGGVGADEADEYDAGIKMDADDKAVGIALDVKDDAIAGQDVGGAIAGFDVGERFPVGVLCFVKLGFERLLGVRVLSPKILQGFPRNDAHRLAEKVPILGTRSSVGLAWKRSDRAAELG